MPNTVYMSVIIKGNQNDLFPSSLLMILSDLIRDAVLSWTYDETGKQESGIVYLFKTKNEHKLMTKSLNMSCLERFTVLLM